MSQKEEGLPGIARRQVTFLVLPRKVTKKRRPRCAAPSGFPRYFANKRGCATRPSRAHKTCPTAELEQCSPKPPLVCEISRRRTGEGKSKNPKSSPDGGQQVAHHARSATGN